MDVTSTLANYDTTSFTAVNSFKVQAPDDSAMIKSDEILSINNENI
jgi:hypothetical protein